MRIAVITLLAALTTSGCVGMAVRAVAQPRKPDFSKLLEKADTNGDGMITAAEFTDARAKMFTRLDRNKDGYLTKDDKRRLDMRGDGERMQELMLMLDKDGDGKISRDEFVNSPSLLFQRADTNHDGTIDQTELAAFKAAMAARK